jgi:ribonuclease D
MREPERLAAAVADALTALGARPWQVELTGPVVTRAVVEADREPVAEPAEDAAGVLLEDPEPGATPDA